MSKKIYREDATIGFPFNNQAIFKFGSSTGLNLQSNNACWPSFNDKFFNCVENFGISFEVTGSGSSSKLLTPRPIF